MLVEVKIKQRKIKCENKNHLEEKIKCENKNHLEEKIKCENKNHLEEKIIFNHINFKFKTPIIYIILII